MKTLIAAGLFAIMSISAFADAPAGLDGHSCAAFDFHDMDDYLGEWSVDWRYRSAPDVYENASATSKIAKRLADCGLRETFVGGKVDRRYLFEWTVVQLNDGAREGVWFDSDHGGFLDFEGANAQDDYPNVFLWRHDNGRMMVRARYTAVDDGAFMVQRHLSTDAGQSWVLTSEMRYARKQ